MFHERNFGRQYNAVNKKTFLNQKFEGIKYGRKLNFCVVADNRTFYLMVADLNPTRTEFYIFHALRNSIPFIIFYKGKNNIKKINEKR